MDNMQDMLGSILSDPDALSKIQKLGSELGLTSDKGSEKPLKSESHSLNQGVDLSALSSLISGTRKGESSGLPDPDMVGMMTKFMPLISSFRKEDESTALLYALRPFLSCEKQKRLDDAGKMLRIMRILPMIKNTGLF